MEELKTNKLLVPVLHVMSFAVLFLREPSLHPRKEKFPPSKHGSMYPSVFRFTESTGLVK